MTGPVTQSPGGSWHFPLPPPWVPNCVTQYNPQSERRARPWQPWGPGAVSGTWLGPGHSLCLLYRRPDSEPCPESQPGGVLSPSFPRGSTSGTRAQPAPPLQGPGVRASSGWSFSTPEKQEAAPSIRASLLGPTLTFQLPKDRAAKGQAATALLPRISSACSKRGRVWSRSLAHCQEVPDDWVWPPPKTWWQKYVSHWQPADLDNLCDHRKGCQRRA